VDRSKGLFKKIACQAALKSGAYIKKHRGKVKKISYKGAINLVTDIDQAAEKIIIRDIKRSFPSHAILAEEAGTSSVRSEYKWVIDPLDGTTNFAHSFPFYCVSIALEYRRLPVLGVVYDPERDELFAAEKGKGAFLNGKRIKVSGEKGMRKSLLATGFAYDVRQATDDNVDNFRKFLKRAQAIRRAGSAALDLCYVACGRFDGFWEFNLHPWDSAAGYLMVEEAGGRVTRFDGTEYTHYDKEILATNGKIHRQMINILSPS
jgi:myo-inositol-1(or 4)-monophosphatase